MRTTKSSINGGRPLADLFPDELIRMAAPEPDQFPYAADTDVEAESALIYSVVALVEPRQVVELGTRDAISTRIMADAMKGSGILYTIDPVDFSSRLDGVACEFIRLPGEAAFEQRPELWADVLFIDTDDHSYEQTIGWLDTWVSHRLVAGGVAMFHDIVPARPEIRVADAVRDWLVGRDGEGWIWREYALTADDVHGPYGLGLLWRAG